MVKRDWRAMRAKVDDEGQCRVCRSRAPGLQAAHIIPRSRSTSTLSQDAENCVPLCTADHREYDERRLDLLPYLSLDEQAHAVLVAGGIVNALERITGTRQ